MACGRCFVFHSEFFFPSIKTYHTQTSFLVCLLFWHGYNKPCLKEIFQILNTSEKKIIKSFITIYMTSLIVNNIFFFSKGHKNWRFNNYIVSRV